MAEVAGIDPSSITAWSQRSTQLREWAAGNLVVNDEGELTAAQLAAAQKATRPSKPEQLAWVELRAGWRTDERGIAVDSAAHRRARHDRLDANGPRFDRHRIADAAAMIEKAAFTRADLIEVIGAQLPVDTARSPRELVEEAVDEIAVRLTAPREAHEREGHERFTLDLILAEEAAVLDLVDAQDPRSILWGLPSDIDGLSPDQQRAVENIAVSPWLVQPLSALLERARPPRCVRWRRWRVAAVIAGSSCWRRRAMRLMSRSAKAPATPATPSPKLCTSSTTTP